MSPDFGKFFRGKRGRIFDLLKDLKWHAGPELALAGGARFGARLLELRHLGYNIVTRTEVAYDGTPTGAYYRLMSLERTLPTPKRVRVYLNQHDAEQLVAGVVTWNARHEVSAALVIFEENKGKL